MAHPKTPHLLTAPHARMLFACAAMLAICTACAGDPPAGVTAILGAFDAEVVLLEEAMEGRRTENHLGVAFTTGTLAGRDVVLARTGIGKVNAAVATALLIEHYAPREVIFTGIAGGLGPDLLPGDIVVATAVVHHDFVALTPDGPQAMATRNPSTGEANPIRFPTDDRLRAHATAAGERAALKRMATSQGERRPQLAEGVIASGDSFVASQRKRAELRERLSAVAVEMEGSAVAQVCYQTNTPFIVIRSLSDSADDAAAEDLERFYEVAAANSAALVHAMLELMAAETRGARR